MKKFATPLFVAAFIALSMSPAGAADVAKGKKVFNKCKACHSLVADKNGVGPSLHGLFGRTAGTSAKYKYSKAMNKAGQGGLVWTEKNLSDYLHKPRAYVKGTKMTFAGLKKQSEIDDLLAFLKGATK